METLSHGFITELVLFGASLLLCALTSFLETSVTALRLFKLKELAQKAGRYKTTIILLEKNPGRILTTILIAKNLVDVSAATLGSALMIKIFSGFSKAMGLWLGIIVVTALILIIGEIIPKITAKAHGEKFFDSTLGIITFLYYTFYPVVNMVVPLSQKITNKLLKGQLNQENHDPVTSEKELQFLIDYISEQGLMDRDKTTMIQSIFELGKKPVKEIMIPATSTVSININANLQDALALFNQHQFSRLPVYSGTTDNIIGMVHLKDIFLICSQKDTKPLKDIIRPILFIPESTKINQLLREFRVQHMHLAIVINEYGSIIGLVSLEDILEEIVGEIRDEYEIAPQKVITLKPDNWIVDTTIDLKSLTDLLNISFETTNAQTLSGFLNEQLQHVPRKGERIIYKNHCFQIQQASAKRALQTLVFKNIPAQEVEKSKQEKQLQITD